MLSSERYGEFSHNTCCTVAPPIVCMRLLLSRVQAEPGPNKQVLFGQQTVFATAWLKKNSTPATADRC